MQRADARPRPVADTAVPSTAAAVETLYRQHAGWLSAQLRRRFGRSTSALVEDVVQETYLRATCAEATPGLRDPRAFLSRIADRLMLDELRGRRRLARVLSDPAALPAAAVAPEQDEALLLKQTLLALPPPLRDVLLMSRVAGLDNAAIAARCGVSVKTVEWRMARALDRCRSSLHSASSGPAGGCRKSPGPS